MLTERDVELTTEVVKNLRAQGDQEYAGALESVLAAASIMVGRAGRLEDAMTINETARALHVRPGTVKAWIASGKLPITRRGSTTLLSRRGLQAYLDEVREAEKGAPAEQPANPERAAAERAFVLGGIPTEVQSRVRTLTE